MRNKALICLLTAGAIAAPLAQAQQVQNADPADLTPVIVERGALDAVTQQRITRLKAPQVATRGAYDVVMMDSAQLEALEGVTGVTPRPDFRLIKLNRGAIDTSVPQPQARRSQFNFEERKLKLVQFAAPPTDADIARLEDSGARIVHYVPSNAFIVWAESGEVSRSLSAMKTAGPVQGTDATSMTYVGDFTTEHAINPALDPARIDHNEPTVIVDVQFYNHEPRPDGHTVEDDFERALTIATGMRRGFWETPDGKYTNATLSVRPEQLDELARVQSVVAILPFAPFERMGERQGMVLAGQLDEQKKRQSGPGYVDWLVGKGFPYTQDSYPIVVVVDDGVESVENPDAPQSRVFREGGLTGAPSRIAFNETFVGDGFGDFFFDSNEFVTSVEIVEEELSTLALDGHGHIDASIMAGMDVRSTFPLHADQEGFIHRLGINPFGRLANTKIFNSTLVTIVFPADDGQPGNPGQIFLPPDFSNLPGCTPLRVSEPVPVDPPDDGGGGLPDDDTSDGSGLRGSIIIGHQGSQDPEMGQHGGGRGPGAIGLGDGGSVRESDGVSGSREQGPERFPRDDDEEPMIEEFEVELEYEAFSTIGTGTFDMVAGQWEQGATMSTNSWGSSTFGLYSVDAQAYDFLTRDATSALGGNQEMVFVFAAGNSGPFNQTVGQPGTSKNVITVGASENFNNQGTDFDFDCAIGSDIADSAQDIAIFSSRGPAADGRTKPDILAPGTAIWGDSPIPSSALNAASDLDQDLGPLDGFRGCTVCNVEATDLGDGLFVRNWGAVASSGTSQATPAIAGYASLAAEFLDRVYGFEQMGVPGAPSPALIKAYIVHSGRALRGEFGNSDLPSNDQGFGLADMNIGFDTSVPRFIHDQETVFSSSGQSTTFSGVIADSTKPLRIALAWTDAPGSVAGNAYLNDLNLRVTVGGQTYLGNYFNSATSVPGGVPDFRNNVESVVLPAGLSGPVTIEVLGVTLIGDGVPGNGDQSDQDFALVAYNVLEDNAALLARDGLIIDDSLTGDGDGVAERGETVELTIPVSNLRGATVTDVTATLSRLTDGVIVDPAPVSYPDIPGNNTRSNTVTFLVTLDDLVSCGDTVMLQLNLATDSGPATFDFELPHGPGCDFIPEIILEDIRIDDTVTGGNGNGVLDPGETANFFFTLRNAGGDSAGVSYTVSDVINASVAGPSASRNLGAIDAGETGVNGLPTRFTANAPGTACGDIYQYFLTVESEEGTFIFVIQDRLGRVGSTVSTVFSDTPAILDLDEVVLGDEIDIPSLPLDPDEEEELFPNPPAFDPPPGFLGGPLGINLTTAEFNVAASGVVEDVNVLLDIDHGSTGDLEAYLVGPDGTFVLLVDERGDTGDDFNRTLFDDEAGLPIAAGAPPFLGSYRPEEPLSAFDGRNSSGLWTVVVFDDGTRDIGQLRSAELTLTVRGFDCSGNITVSATDPVDVMDVAGNNNGNGVAEPGENGVQLMLPVVNLGVQEVTGLMGTLTSLTAGVTIADGTATYPDLEPGDDAANSDVLAINVSSGFQCGQDIVLQLQLDANEGAVTLEYTIPSGEFTATQFSQSASGLPLAFGADPNPQEVVIPFTVGVAGSITDIDVNLTVQHPHVGDVRVTLRKVDGPSVLLFRNRGNDGDNLSNTVFDDEAATAVSSGTPPFSGSFRPDEALSAFDGIDPKGSWELVVRDTFRSLDDGTVTFAQIRVNYDRILCDPPTVD